METFREHIVIKIYICYNASRQSEVSVHTSTQRKPPDGIPGVFFWLVVIAIAIQPFDDVVAGYTTHDSDQK